MTSTSSDEQYRIKKAISGSNGMSCQDALDEIIDNGLDEDAKLIGLTFYGKKLRKVYNDLQPQNRLLLERS